MYFGAAVRLTRARAPGYLCTQRLAGLLRPHARKRSGFCSAGFAIGSNTGRNIGHALPELPDMPAAVLRWRADSAHSV